MQSSQQKWKEDDKANYDPTDDYIQNELVIVWAY